MVRFIGLLLALVAGIACKADAEQGRYFAKKHYEPHPLPVFETTKDKLPSPVFDEDQSYAACYWKAWEIAFRNFHEPAPQSGFVSQFIDAAFNENIFLWDTCFLTMFCNYAHPHVPGIRSLDNFYARQYEDGEICREINRTTGRDYPSWVNAGREPLFSRWGFDLHAGHKRAGIEYRGRPAPKPNPILTLDALNHPIFAWAELESYRVTGDIERLKMVWEPLVRYYGALQKYIRQGNGLYMTDWASMDNSARNPGLAGGGTAIDTSCEMVLFTRNLAEIARAIGKAKQADKFAKEADELAGIINDKMWDPEKRFYYDLTVNEDRIGVKTIAAFWTLLAGVASQEQAKALAAELENPKTFKTLHRVPTLAADEKSFSPTGDYWCGAAWAPTNVMVVRGLERYGYTDLARDIALNHLDNVVKVFRQTGTIWENYAPQELAPGRPAKKDFVGWSGIAPIALLLEYKIGLRPDAANNTLTWRIASEKRLGVERYWFAGKTASLMCSPAGDSSNRNIRVSSNAPFRLVIILNGRTRTIEIRKDEPVEIDL
ncbi:MAG: hypothetical protein JXN61_09695 [Sedimentisphaerales bacterium]|nr:hypothetical protein [Sedimentisphaerales bacterium]